MWLSKIFVILAIVFGLTGCQQQNDYVRFFENPQLLADTLTKCQQGKMVGKSCLQANMSKQIMSEFATLSESFILAQQRFLTLQQQLQRDPNNIFVQKALIEQEDILNQEFTLLQENYAKQIMSAETMLAKLKIAQKELKINMAVNKASDAQKAAILQKQALIKRQALFMEEKIRAMLIFVGLSNTVAG